MARNRARLGTGSGQWLGIEGQWLGMARNRARAVARNRASG